MLLLDCTFSLVPIFAVLAQAPAPIMSPSTFFEGLTQWGPMGIIAAIILWLHHHALTAFREELKEQRKQNSLDLADERKQHEADWGKIMDLKLRHHEQQMAAINSLATGFNRFRQKITPAKGEGEPGPS